MNKKEKDFSNAMNGFFLIWDQTVPILNTDIRIIRQSFIDWIEWMKKRDE